MACERPALGGSSGLLWEASGSRNLDQGPSRWLQQTPCRKALSQGESMQLVSNARQENTPTQGRVSEDWPDHSEATLHAASPFPATCWLHLRGPRCSRPGHGPRWPQFPLCLVFCTSGSWAGLILACWGKWLVNGFQHKPRQWACGLGVGTVSQENVPVAHASSNSSSCKPNKNMSSLPGWGKDLSEDSSLWGCEEHGAAAAKPPVTAAWLG